MLKRKWILGLGIFGLSLLLQGNPVFAGLAETQDILEKLPVQHQGRIKPFLSFASESVLAITGSRSYQGMSPTLTVFQWMADPEDWETRPMISVGFRPLKKYFPALVKNKVSVQVIFGQQSFADFIDITLKKQAMKQALTTIEKEALSLYEKAYRFRQITHGEVPGWVPNPQDPRGGWLPLEWLKIKGHGEGADAIYPAEASAKAGEAWASLLQEIQKNPASEASTQRAGEFFDAMVSLAATRDMALDGGALKEEIIYGRLHPFGWAWRFYFMSFFLFLLLVHHPVKFLKTIPASSRNITAMIFYIAGFFFHSFGFYLRCVIAGRPPVTNMYESIIWVSWAVVLVATVLYALYRSSILVTVAGVVATFALIVAESFPAVLDPTVSPLVPVLRSNLWLTVHVLTITFSYGAFALAWALGHVVTTRYVIWPNRHQGNEALTQYLYRALQVGVILLASGTVLGGVWANYSWGRFWGWDPKETWALIALLGYMAILHARYAGWLDRFGIAAWSVAAFSLVVMAWYGVNYVLAAGLHSYGFGGGGAPYVISIFMADFIAMYVLSLYYKKRLNAK